MRTPGTAERKVAADLGLRTGYFDLDLFPCRVFPGDARRKFRRPRLPAGASD